MRIFLVSALALLSACAPSATTSGTTSTRSDGPLPSGETWTISGLDQNNNKISGTVKLSGAPEYDSSDGTWAYDGDRGYVLHYGERATGTRFTVWDMGNRSRLVACYVFTPFSRDQKTYTGAGLAGTREEINAVFAKLSGSGTRLVGGDCTVTRS